MCSLNCRTAYIFASIYDLVTIVQLTCCRARTCAHRNKDTDTDFRSFYLLINVHIYTHGAGTVSSAGAGNYGIRGGPYVGMPPYVGIGGLGQGPGIQMVYIILLPPSARKHMESGPWRSICAL